MPKIIGLTGGIGSGKTTIAKYFESLGVAVYITDDEARKITNSKAILKSIKDVFGIFVFDNNLLNRKKLSEIVFKNPDKLKQLNAIIHPAVKIHFDNWFTKHAQEKFIIKESAILFESGAFKYCDFIITVTASIETRIERVMIRDKISREEVLIRMNNQWTDEQRIAKTNYIIKNEELNLAKLECNAIYESFSVN